MDHALDPDVVGLDPEEDQVRTVHGHAEPKVEIVTRCIAEGCVGDPLGVGSQLGDEGQRAPGAVCCDPVPDLTKVLGRPRREADRLQAVALESIPR
jgi:hypothetical protein